MLTASSKLLPVGVMGRNPLRLRLGAHCTERPEVNQDKPELTEPLARPFEPLHTETTRTRSACTNPAANPMLSGSTGLAADRTGLSPLHDVKLSRPPRPEPSGIRFFFKYGCNGGARRDRTDDLKLAKLALSQLSYGPNSFRTTTPELAFLQPPAAPKRGEWWAWEDLNFRPHAYQARALTN